MDQIPIKDTKAFVVSFPLKEVCQENLSAFIYLPEAEFLGEIQTKVLTVFLLAINSHLSALPWDFYFFKIKQPLTVSTVQYVPDRKLYPLPYG